MVKLGKYDAEPVLNCPICKAIGSHVTYSKTLNKEPLVVNVFDCPTCGCMYLSPRMTESSMAEFYTSGDYISDVLPRRMRGTFGERSRALRIVTMLVSLKNVQRPKRALDIGCSQGHLLQRIRDWSYQVDTVGYDIHTDEDAVHPVVNSKDDIKGTFDLITCIHVLEHMYDPMEQLHWMDSLLNPGGLLVLELPTERYILVEHPVVFDMKAIPLMMDAIGIEHYTTFAPPQTGSIILFGKKND